jgi:Ca2+-binding RTX toxin-like protein
MNAHPLFVASEQLESRRLFAVNLTDGLLTVEGTGDGDVISLVARGSMLTVRVNAERTMHNLDAIDEVLVNALGGNDRVTLGKLAVNAAVDAGAGDDRVTGGRGDDVIVGGDGNDRLSGNSGDDQLFGAAGSDRLFGNDGDDELDGGAGTDLLNGGNGFDLTDLGPDIVTGVENQGGNIITDDNGTTFGRIGNTLRPLQPLDTTGFNTRPGNNVISPNLSSSPAGNATFFDPFTGVTLQAGGVFVNLPNHGAFGRELSQGLPGLAGAAINDD